MFNPYNCAEITDVAPTQSTQCGGTTSSATVLKMEQVICRSDGIAKTLDADCVHNGTARNMMVYKDFRIRKLTPRECWRLMGFKDKYFDRVKGISNTQLYKQAGNSIVVDVLKYIFEELHNQYPEYFSKDEWGSDL